MNGHKGATLSAAGDKYYDPHCSTNLARPEPGEWFRTQGSVYSAQSSDTLLLRLFAISGC
jgi:hypothetical protein